ncbi:cytochrome b5-related protein-like [Penaeus chinensis]|uniref:cytochrome b5-related protein-like n=1 Tax=Penaeus chinensis TaxID=139456 RepID=UPI001FB85443|nr:cytochrome b5-related protein-like [Penaeus chinensis]XP_047492198.1 cytochrome b5-related protein-like [Penaeus chinensis]
MAPRSRSHGPSEAPRPKKKFATGFRCYPSNRDAAEKSAASWMEGKRIDDDVGPYWRVHDKIYDLEKFIDKHPGGKDWLLATRGTDITEAFESSHISASAEKILSRYYLKVAAAPRVSPYTFHDDGFFRTFKRKVRPILQKVGRGPDWKITLIQDGLALTFAALAVAAILTQSFVAAALGGVVLAMVSMCAHNFFHQRDNWRMYLFDLTLLSSYDWRITHALSHHLFTNTIYDFEISGLEPVFEFLPKANKTWLQRYGSFFYSVPFFPLFFYLEALKKWKDIAFGWKEMRPENALPILELVVYCVFVPSSWTGLKLWLAMHCACSMWFSFVGLTAAHHHPDIYHEGDAMRDNPDWGLCQLDAVRDRVEVTGNLFLVSTTFGDHSLHHLLPTVDHSKLKYLYPAFFETCKEFNVPFQLVRQWELVCGKYLQLANITPNERSPGYKAKAKS